MKTKTIKVLKLRKEVKAFLLGVLMVIACVWASNNGAMATENVWGAIKIVLAWCSVPMFMLYTATITK